MGVDSAGGGVDGDYACAEVIDRRSGMQCAELHGHLPPEELARRVAELGKEYNDAMLAVERNGQGAEVLLFLQNFHRYENLYDENGKAGPLTTIRSRSEIIAAVAMALSQPVLVNSPRLLRELRTFVRRRDGSGAAASGAHDDCVIAFGIALRVRERLAGDGSRSNASWGYMPERASGPKLQ
jgi:hypothetical protein